MAGWVYPAQSAGDKVWVLPFSGAAYRNTGRGWVRLNPEKNKHQRRAEQQHWRPVKPH